MAETPPPDRNDGAPLGSESNDSDSERIETQANSNAISRTLAVMILMLLPGVAGFYLDKWLGTSFFIILGFAIGILIAIVGLLYVAKIADVAAQKSSELRKQQKRDA